MKGKAMGLSQVNMMAVVGTRGVAGELAFLRAEADVMTGWRKVAQTMEVRKLETRLQVIRMTQGLEDAKRQLARDLANKGLSHSQRMFMAADSHRIIARYESGLRLARQHMAQAQVTQSDLPSGATLYSQTVAGEKLSYVRKPQHVHNTVCARFPQNCR